MRSPVEHRYPQFSRLQIGNQRGNLPNFTKNKSKKKLSFKITCSRKIKLYKKFVVYLYKKCLRSSNCERVMLLVNELIFSVNLMATINLSDNKTKLIVFSSSSGSAFGPTVKSSK